MAALSEEELAKLGSLFEELGVKPSLESAEGLRDWMKTLSKPSVKQEPIEKVARTSPTVRVKEVTKETCRPRLSVFTGTTGKEGTTYDVWRYEVTCLLADGLHSTEAILEAVRRSVKGDPAKILMRLGPRADIHDILHKLDGFYGQVATEGTLLTLFYAAKQKEDEDVTSWSCRLEDLIQRVQERGLIDRRTMAEMLRSKLWTGLSDERLRQATRHRFDSIKDYDELVVAIRSVEQEYRGQSGEKKTQEKKAKSQVIQKSAETEDKTLQMLKNLGDRLEKIEKDVQQLKQEGPVARKEEEQETSRRQFQGRGRGRRGDGRRWQDTRPRKTEELTMSQTEGGQDFRQEVTCYRCGQVGHIALGCRVRTDHLRNLNGGSPLPGGKQ